MNSIKNVLPSPSGISVSFGGKTVVASEVNEDGAKQCSVNAINRLLRRFMLKCKCTALICLVRLLIANLIHLSLTNSIDTEHISIYSYGFST